MAVKKKISDDGDKPVNDIDQIYQMGIEAAFSGVDPKRFITRDENEEKVFLEGYKNGLEIQQKDIEEEQTMKVA